MNGFMSGVVTAIVVPLYEAVHRVGEWIVTTIQSSGGS